MSSHEDPLSVADGFGGADGDVEREWPWVDVLPECDRRLFAEEMSQLMAEAAETDDLAPVEQALREWRVTAETYSDPGLARLMTGPAWERRASTKTRRLESMPRRRDRVAPPPRPGEWDVRFEDNASAKGMGAGLPRLALKRAGRRGRRLRLSRGDTAAGSIG